jgi:putative transposase
MKQSTRSRGKAIRGFKEMLSKQDMIDLMYQTISKGKAGLDAMLMRIGKTMAEAVMYMEREELSGPDYHPTSDEIQKWASQRGSIYLGDQKIAVEHPRVRGADGEIELQSYKKLKDPGAFSEELLNKILRGISCRKYGETVIQTANAFGVSASSVSRHIITATTKKLKEFKERSLAGIDIFAVYIDTIHRGGGAFAVGLGIDKTGIKHELGFWEGATEDHEICENLLSDIERRGLKLTKKVIWITDGGSGIIKALRDKFGKKVLHQRCVIHKDRNIQKHLPKRYRKEAHRRFMTAIEQNSYEDARKMLTDMQRWLRGINESAADSLQEAIEEILTVHRLKITGLLKKVLYSTNPIESMFSTVRHSEKNIKRYRGSHMLQRWLAAVLLHCEKGFRRVKGYESIPELMMRIEGENYDAVKEAA